MKVTVSAPDIDPVAFPPQEFDFHLGSAVINEVPEGSNRVVTLEAMGSSGGTTIWTGSDAGIPVAAGVPLPPEEERETKRTMDSPCLGGSMWWQACRFWPPLGAVTLAVVVGVMAVV